MTSLSPIKIALRPDHPDFPNLPLREIEDLRLPAVIAAGHALTQTAQGEASVLITRHLDRSLPYRSLFMRSSMERCRAHL